MRNIVIIAIMVISMVYMFSILLNKYENTKSTSTNNMKVMPKDNK